MKYLSILLLAALCGCGDGMKPLIPDPLPAKIVFVAEQDSAISYGKSGYTIIEFTNGTRRMIGGRWGAVGETFLYQP
jgi:hypothetical protein